MTRLLDLLPSLEYELCVLTGDYRGKNFGPFNQCLAGMARLREALNEPLYGVLGDHDTIRMVPDLEAMGIRMLLNDCVVIERGGHLIHLAGIDDAHFYRVDDIEKAADAIPHEDFSILLSHTPEIYRQAAAAGFDLLLSGHTHGGQICLPGGIPLTLDATLPRSLGSGAWKYRDMAGYTSVGAGSSVVPVRFIVRRRSRFITCVQPEKGETQYGRSWILNAYRAREATSSPTKKSAVTKTISRTVIGKTHRQAMAAGGTPGSDPGQPPCC